MLALPYGSIAQTNETVHADKRTMAERDDEVFNFPDNIMLSKNELNKRVEEKTTELAGYIRQIAEARAKGDSANDLIEKAMLLFNNDKYATVTVTRKSLPEPVTVPVRTYLNRLDRLKYDKVRIKWNDARYVSKFTKRPDGSYAGIVAYEQKFTGIRGSEVNYTYSDVTRKNIEVIFAVHDAKDMEQGRKAYVQVFLGNIGITED